MYGNNYSEYTASTPENGKKISNIINSNSHNYLSQAALGYENTFLSYARGASREPNMVR